MLQGNQLPIVHYRKDIIDAIRDNKVIIVSGVTGCGKSTQVPKYILQSEPKANVAVCEPRRIAAKSLAYRMRDELGATIGDRVGYIIGHESQAHPERTKLTYMTYGIFIKKLFYQTELPYTHIIMDEVHERSLEIDFTFIALKKLLKGKSNVRLIVMSATLKSTLFANYFPVSPTTGQFLQPIIIFETGPKMVIGERPNGRSTGMVAPSFRLDYGPDSYKAAKEVELPLKRNYKVFQYYLDDLITNFANNREDRADLSETTLTAAIKIICESTSGADVLVFLPGLAEITLFKNKLIGTRKIDSSRILELHSAFREDIHARLFQSNERSRIILSTNIGQSSITLTNCQIVIDFCLDRSVATNSQTRTTTFTTSFASKSSLTQRAGRVGRVSDGYVYRMITKNQYEKLDDYNVPEIKKAGLQKVILESKQIGANSQSKLFDDPYDVFLNAVEPPSISQIELAIDELFKYGALTLDKTVKDVRIHARLKYCGPALKVTESGHFMASMPCDVKTTRLVLLGVKVRIPRTMVDIASIISLSKGFFIHEKKRTNLEEFMHSMVEFDDGRFNDYMLRKQLYTNWKKNFVTGRPTQVPQYIDEEDDDAEAFMEDSSYREREWCFSRGIHHGTMRQIWEISSRISRHLRTLQVQFPQFEQVSVDLVNFCLSSVYFDKENQLTVEEDRRPDAAYKPNSILMKANPIIDIDILNKYYHPYVVEKIEPEGAKKVRVYGSEPIVAKTFLAVAIANKVGPVEGSSFFKFLQTNPIEVEYKYSIGGGNRKIKILGESINRHLQPGPKRLALTHYIIDYMERILLIPSCAIVRQSVYEISLLLIGKQILLESHPSKCFWQRACIDGFTFRLAVLLNDNKVKTILAARQQLDVCGNLEPLDKNVYRDLQQILLDKEELQPEEDWQIMFLKTTNRMAAMDFVPIEHCGERVSEPLTYYSEYNLWKHDQLSEQSRKFFLLNTEEPKLICSRCYPRTFSVIDALDCYDPALKKLTLNQFTGSWKYDDGKLKCLQNHVISEKVKINEAIGYGDAMLEEQALLMLYIPYNNSVPLPKTKEELLEILNRVPQYLLQKAREEESVVDWNCIVCYQNNDQLRTTSKVLRGVLSYNNKVPQYERFKSFWSSVKCHQYDRKHQDRLEMYKRNMKPLI